jgi:hypothetical protein
VEEKGILLIHLISFTSGRERYPFDTSDLLHVWKRKVPFPHVNEIRCINRIPFSSTREGDQMYQKDTFLFYMRRRSDVSKRYLSLPHVNEIRCIKILAFSSTREGDQMYQKDTFLFHTRRRSKGYLSLPHVKEIRMYLFDTSDLLRM